MTTPQVLLLPGWQNSGPTHWQSLWQAAYGYARVEQHDWMRPLRGDWVARLQEAVLARVDGAQTATPCAIVLVAHSLGCHLVAAWAALSLVAPSDPRREEWPGVLASWRNPVLDRLPFPSLLLGSHDDPYCSFARAQAFAAAWDARFVDCGHCGHINADAGLGAWPHGHAMVRQLCQASAGAVAAPD